MLGVKRAPIPEEKKTELVVEATRMERPPRATEIERATRFIEQEPELTAREALERAKGQSVNVNIRACPLVCWVCGELVERVVDSSLVTAEEILNYAEEELEKAVRSKDMLLYRNASDKAFLSMIVAVNSFISRKLDVTPKSHGERRSLLRKMDREDLRALYSDVMRTLHDEAFYEGVYNPEETKYAVGLVRRMLEEFKKD